MVAVLKLSADLPRRLLAPTVRNGDFSFADR
jgi:hypothetical protein